MVFGLVLDIRGCLTSRGDDAARGHALLQDPHLWPPAPPAADPAPVFVGAPASQVVPKPTPPPALTDVASPGLFVPGAPPLPVTVAAQLPSAPVAAGGAPLLVCRGEH